MHHSMGGHERTLISEHLHEQRVLLPAINDVGGSHTLCQASRAALHPAAAGQVNAASSVEGIHHETCQGLRLSVGRTHAFGCPALPLQSHAIAVTSHIDHCRQCTEEV